MRRLGEVEVTECGNVVRTAGWALSQNPPPVPIHVDAESDVPAPEPHPDLEPEQPHQPLGREARHRTDSAGLRPGKPRERTIRPARGEEGREPVLVFTGDLANEFLVDYHPERYKGTTYYELPRLPAVALRASLVRGLDSCHREVGVFGAWGLSVVQPYAVAVDAYLALDSEFLGREERKQELCREIFGDLLPGYVYSRPKVRAQAGSPGLGGGVLAACASTFDVAWPCSLRSSSCISWLLSSPSP